MTCDEALEMISAALDGELSARERRALDAHLEECPDCKALFDELAGQSRLLRELDCQVPEDLSQRVLSKLPRWRTTVKFWRQMGTVAVCLALALSLGALFLARGPKFNSSGGAFAGGSSWPRDTAETESAEPPQAALWSRDSAEAEAAWDADAEYDVDVFAAPAEAPVPAPEPEAVMDVSASTAAEGYKVTGPTGLEPGEYRFTAVVLEVHDRYLLVEVTDNTGYDSLYVGSRIEVSTGAVSLDDCPALVPGQYAEIVFDGVVLQTDPAQIYTVFSIAEAD